MVKEVDRKDIVDDDEEKFEDALSERSQEDERNDELNGTPHSGSWSASSTSALLTPSSRDSNERDNGSVVSSSVSTGLSRITSGSSLTWTQENDVSRTDLPSSSSSSSLLRGENSAAGVAPQQGLERRASLSSMAQINLRDTTSSLLRPRLSYGRRSSTPLSNSYLPRRHRKGATTRVITPNPLQVYSRDRRRAVQRAPAQNSPWFQRLGAQWAAEDDEQKKRVSTITWLFWFPILMILQLVNIWYYLFFPVIKTFGSVFGYDWKYTPIWTEPLEKKKQALCVCLFVFMLPSIVVAYTVGLVFLLFPLTTLPMALYILFIAKLDRSPIDGSRQPFMRYWKIWQHYAGYFPLRLIKTKNLDPKHKYVFAYHPHGILSMGAFGNFATDATGFSRKFPGINLRVLTLKMNFNVPWLRELLLFMGICSCEEAACNEILSKKRDTSILLVVGGAKESLYVRKGTIDLCLDRKGFCRIAINKRAHLVPVISFGENDVYETYVFKKGSWGHYFQNKFKKTFGFATPIFYGKGRGFWMPHRTPIVSVVGRPLKPPKLPKYLDGYPDWAKTEIGHNILVKFHQEYIAALLEVYNQYKDEFAIDRQESLSLIRGESKKKN